MKRGTIKTFSVGCILLALFLSAFISLSQPVQAANTATVTVGGTPYAVAITPDGKYAYVPNAENVSVINTATNKVTATVTARNWPAGIAITPDGKYAYVPDTNTPTNQGGIVSVISIATNTVTATITVGGNPNHGVAITPDGKYVYVTNFDGTVAVISTATNTVTANITIGTQSAPSVVSTGPKTITIEGGSTIPQAVAITPNGEYAYVANGDGTVSAINTTTNTVTATITLAGNPNALAVTPNGEYAYVCAMNSSGMVTVINTATNTVTATITGFGSPNGIAMTPDGRYAYVTDGFNNSVSVINTATNTVDRTVTVGTTPYGIAITPNGEYVYVTNLAYVATDSPVVNWIGTVSVISTDANTAPTDSSSPSPSPSPPALVSAFSTQSLTIIALIAVIIVLSAVIIAKRKTGKTRDKRQASAENRLDNQAK